jgi:hypothetical protein
MFVTLDAATQIDRVGMYSMPTIPTRLAELKMDRHQMSCYL